MSKELIRLDNCTMAFDNEIVLDNINLYINDKEFLTLLGPSGCGKTTTLRIIGGFQTPTSGDVLFDGVRMNSVPPHKRAINTVFQKYALFPHLNVYENIAFGLRIPKADADGKKVKLSEKEIHSRVMEMLEIFGIPVMTEYSSYEEHPLGRVEWVKFFGALTDKEDRAEELFREQDEILKQITANESTDRTVAFFYITSNGLAQVRQSSDYIAKSIALAGGRYIFEDMEDSGTGRSTVNMQLEEFYAGAKDADYIIYNSSIDGGISSVSDLLDKCPVLSDFKAVQEGNVFCTTNDMYQQSMSIGYMIDDMHKMLTGEEDMRYLFRLK